MNYEESADDLIRWLRMKRGEEGAGAPEDWSGWSGASTAVATTPAAPKTERPPPSTRTPMPDMGGDPLLEWGANLTGKRRPLMPKEKPVDVPDVNRPPLIVADTSQGAVEPPDELRADVPPSGSGSKAPSQNVLVDWMKSRGQQLDQDASARGAQFDDEMKAAQQADREQTLSNKIHSRNIHSTALEIPEYSGFRASTDNADRVKGKTNALLHWAQLNNNKLSHEGDLMQQATKPPKPVSDPTQMTAYQKGLLENKDDDQKLREAEIAAKAEAAKLKREDKAAGAAKASAQAEANAVIPFAGGQFKPRAGTKPDKEGLRKAQEVASGYNVAIGGVDQLSSALEAWATNPSPEARDQVIAKAHAASAAFNSAIGQGAMAKDEKAEMSNALGADLTSTQGLAAFVQGIMGADQSAAQTMTRRAKGVRQMLDGFAKSSLQSKNFEFEPGGKAADNQKPGDVKPTGKRKKDKNGILWEEMSDGTARKVAANG